MVIERTKLAALLSAGTLAAALLGGCGGLGEGNVAKLDNTYITEADLNKRADIIALRAGIGEGLPGAPEDEAAKIKKQAAKQLVDEELLKRELSNRGVEVTDEEVQATFDDVVSNNFGGNKEHLLIALQGNEEEVKGQIRTQLVEEKMRELIFAEVGINDDEVRAAYQTFVNNYKTSEWRQLGIVVVADEATAQQVKQRLESGEELTKLVTEYSIDESTKDKKGLVSLQKTREDVLPADVKAVAFSTVVGQVGGPVKSDKGYYVVLVEQVEPDKETSFELVKPLFEARARQDKYDQAWRDFIRQMEEKAGVIYREDVNPQ